MLYSKIFIVAMENLYEISILSVTQVVLPPLRKCYCCCRRLQYLYCNKGSVSHMQIRESEPVLQYNFFHTSAWCTWYNEVAGEIICVPLVPPQREEMVVKG